jgi:hypothetical protein
MVHWYVQDNSHGLTIRVKFMVNVCVGGSFESNGFVTKVQPFPMDGHYRTERCGPLEVGFDRATSVMYGSRAIFKTPVLYSKSLRITSTLLRRGSISGRSYD